MAGIGTVNQHSEKQSNLFKTKLFVNPFIFVNEER